MPGELVCISVHGGEGDDCPSGSSQKTRPLCLDAREKRLDNALYSSTVLKWSLQVCLEQILGVYMTSKRNGLIWSHFPLPLN